MVAGGEKFGGKTHIFTCSYACACVYVYIYVRPFLIYVHTHIRDKACLVL